MSLLQAIVDTVSGTVMDVANSESIEAVPSPEKGNNEIKLLTPTFTDGSSTNGEDSSNNKSDAMFEITNMDQAITLDDEKKESEPGKPVSVDDDTASKSSVSFGSVRVREYERVMDSTGKYMGLALGWDYNERPSTPVLEKTRNHATKYAGLAHGGEESRMKRTNGSDRYGMMIRYGYSQRDMKDATKEAAKFYKQRSREAARSIVVKDQKSQQENNGKPKRRMLRSMFA